jgi:protein gp37
MAGLSEIEWTDATWNPVSGCTIISPGCTNCYAMRMAARLQAMGHASYRGVTRKSGKRHVWSGKVILNDRVLDVPKTWLKPRRIFVNSMSDLFQDGVPAEFVQRIWQTMAETPHHIYQILTKRPDNMRRVIDEGNFPKLEHVWLGTSVESSDYLDRIEMLKHVSGVVKFISFEPLIASVGEPDLRGIDWAIVGGESGPAARPIREEWIDEIKAACDRTNTAFFFKQWGGVQKKKTGRTYRDRIWNDLPRNLQGNSAA